MLRSFFHSKRIRPSHIIGTIFVLTVMLISEYAMTFSGGKTGQTAKPGSGNGCTCHCANANGSTTVTVNTAGTTFEGGQTYTFTVNVSSSDGNHSRAGFNAAVGSGTLNVGSDATVQKIGDEVTHTGPKQLNASWSFTWTAPNTAGQVTMYVTANAVNFDGTNGTGNCTDKWNHATNFVMNVTVPNRSLALTRSTIAFGNVRVGSGARSDTLRIVSNGDVPVTVASSAMKNTSPFSAAPSGTNRQLSVGTQEVNTITYNPTASGLQVDTFVVNSNASTAADQRKTVVVTATGVQAIFTGNNTFPFNNVRVGQTKDLVYTYQNTGNDTLFVTGANLQSSTFFTIQGPVAATIPPGGNGTVNLRYSPTSKQTHSTQLTFTASNSIATPTVTITGTGTAPQLSTLGLLQMGPVKIGGSVSKPLDLENIGTDTLTITSVTIAPGFQGTKFTVGSGSGPVLAGSKLTVNVNYQPTVIGNDTAKIIVVSNDPTVPTREILVLGRGAIPKMKITGPDTVKFGDVRLGSSSTLGSVIIENIGEAELQITLLMATPDQFTIATPVPSVGGGSNRPVNVKFTPTAEGPITGTLYISGDDATFPRDTIYLSGTGTVSQFDTPSEINYGDVKMLAHRDSTFYLRNLGTAPVTIGAYSIAGPAGAFTFQDTSKHTVPPKDSIGIKVRFTALDDISYAGTLTIRTTESGNSSRTISLKGRGIDSKLSLSDASLEFGDIDTMQTSSKSVTITNTGTAPIAINTLALSGPQVSAFSKAHSALPKTLGPTDTMQVHLTFAPVDSGDHDATLAITPAEGSSLNVLLHGFGVVDSATVIDTTGQVVRNAYHLDVPFTLSPNPTRGAVTATFELMTSDEVRFTVISIDGKLVETIASEAMPAGKHEVRFNTGALANGEYLVRMTNRKGQFIEERFILLK